MQDAALGGPLSCRLAASSGHGLTHLQLAWSICNYAECLLKRNGRNLVDQH